MIEYVLGRIDEFVKWHTAGVGAVVVLSIANADKLLAIVSAPSFKWSMGLLLGALLLDTFARILGTLTMGSCDVVIAMDEKIPDALGSKRSYQPRAPLSEEVKRMLLEFTDELTRPMLWHVRVMARRAAKAAAEDNSGADRTLFPALKMSQWQSIAALAALLLSIAGASIAVFNVTIAPSAPPFEANVQQESTDPAIGPQPTRMPVSRPVDLSIRSIACAAFVTSQTPTQKRRPPSRVAFALLPSTQMGDAPAGTKEPPHFVVESTQQIPHPSPNFLT